ncbi:inositol monophosphatase family protein [Salinibacterium sp. GXW1014]|uniref:inositol monophosphatase family protein n=1 Tax=Salinibacterium sp. GXW1014 TaxID=3377838 RepID=UPI00383B3328
MTDAAQLLSFASDLAREAGVLARRRRVEGVSVAASKSTAVDIVTHADREVEALIRDRLKAERPEDGFFGEESGAEVGSSGLTWVVDPIDGTVNYLYGIPQYAVSIAVVEGEPDPLTWRAVAGVVFNPESGELFAATAGGGATLDGRPIQATTDVPPERALVGTGFGYRPEVRVAQAKALVGLLSQVRDIRRIGAASLDLCAVACGRLDAYFETGLQPWDHAAGALIAREAGARVTGWEGTSPSATFTLAADAPLAEFLERTLLISASDWE